LANVLSEFAVLLGWQIDTASQARAKKALQEVEAGIDRSVAKEKTATQELEREHRRRVESAERMGRDIGVALGRSIGGSVGQLIRLAATLGTAFAGIRLFENMISDLKSLQDESQKAGASVRNIQAIQFAFGQLGSTGAEATGAINALAQAMRENPGIRTYLQQNFNVGPEVTDTVTMLEKMAARLREMPSHVAIAYGQVAGLSEEMVRIMRLPNFPQALAEARRLQAAWGVDLETMAQRAKALVDEYQKLSLQATNIRITVMGALLQAAGPFMQGLNETLEKNSGTISKVINDLSDSIRSWASAGSQQLLDWFKELFDPKNAEMQRGWIEWANNFRQASTDAATAIQDITHGLREGVEFAKELWRTMNAVADVISGKHSGLGLEGMLLDPKTTPTPGTVGPPIPPELRGGTDRPGWVDVQRGAAEKQADAAKKFSDAVDEDKRQKDQERAGGGMWSRFTGYIGNLLGMGGGAGGGPGGGIPGGFGGVGATSGAGGVAAGMGGLGPAGKQGGAPLGVPNVGNMSADEKNKLGLILKYESNYKNQMNYAGKASGLDPTTPKGYTAQGYYQILNSNWQRIAPKLGINTPNAMASSFEDQTKVALALMREPGQGIGHWANYNPKLRAALAAGEQAPEGAPLGVPDIGGGGAGVRDQGRAANIAALNRVTAAATAGGDFITSTVRSPNDPLSRANPHSAHTQGRAFDMRARTLEEGEAAMKRQRERFSAIGLREGEDYTMINEADPAQRSGWATGPHVHVQMKPAGIAKINSADGSGGRVRVTGLGARVNEMVGDRANAIMVGQNARTAAAPGGALSEAPAPIASPTNNDNSRTVTQTNEYNTTIHATDANAAANAMRRSNEINSGLAISGLKGAIR
jgi:hypothetical protein